MINSRRLSQIEEMVKNNEELDLEQIKYLMYKTANKEDYLILNYIEKKIKENYGSNFMNHSRDKIAYLTQLLLNDDPNEIYKFYRGVFNEYMKQQNFKFEAITSFNLLFMAHMHIALKIIRASNN